MESLRLAHLSAKKFLFDGDAKWSIYQHGDRKFNITRNDVPFVIDFTTERPFNIDLPEIQITLAINENGTRYYTQQSSSNSLPYEVICIMERDKDEIQILLKPGGTCFAQVVYYRAVFDETGLREMWLGKENLFYRMSFY